jgi:hypothetical protein
LSKDRPIKHSHISTSISFLTILYPKFLSYLSNLNSSFLRRRNLYILYTEGTTAAAVAAEALTAAAAVAAAPGPI